MTLHLDPAHSPATRFLAQFAAIHEHARAAFEVHPGADRIEFDMHFPSHIEHVTVDRNNLPRLAPDYDAWRRRVEERFEREEFA